MDKEFVVILPTHTFERQIMSEMTLFLFFLCVGVLWPSQQWGRVEPALFLGRLRPSKWLTSAKQRRPQQ